MPITNPRGYPFPTSGQTPDVVRDVRALAEAVNDDVVSVDDDLSTVASDIVAIQARLDALESGTTSVGWIPIQNGFEELASQFDVDLTDGARFPAGEFQLVRLHMRYDLDAVGNILMRVNDSSSAVYRSGLVNKNADDGSTSISDHFVDDTDWHIGRGATISTNNMVLTLFHTNADNAVNFQATSNRQSDTANVHQWIEAWGALTSGVGTPSSLQVFPDGATQFQQAWWWAEGFRLPS